VRAALPLCIAFLRALVFGMMFAHLLIALHHVLLFSDALLSGTDSPSGLASS
jgi:hypothetical protein